MGSSTSKPRRGHGKPGHLPKVGTPANLAWRHDTRIRQVFGSNGWRTVAIIAAALALVGLVIIIF